MQQNIARIEGHFSQMLESLNDQNIVSLYWLCFGYLAHLPVHRAAALVFRGSTEEQVWMFIYAIKSYLFFLRLVYCERLPNKSSVSHVAGFSGIPSIFCCIVA